MWVSWSAMVPCIIPVQRRKWPPTANDPQIGPQMIPPENVNGMEFGFPDFLFYFYFLIFVFIYFHQLNGELDEHKETIFWQRKL